MRWPWEAYVSEQNLLPDHSDEPVGHPQVRELFGELCDGLYAGRDLKPH